MAERVEVEVYPFRRERASRRLVRPKFKAARRKKTRARPWSLKRDLVLVPGRLAVFGGGFFLARAVLLGELFPFGLAFVAASTWVFGRTGLVALAGVLAGLFTVGGGYEKGAEMLAAGGIAAVVKWLPPGAAKRPWLVVPGVVFGVVIICRAGFLALSDPTPYGYVSTLFEAVFAGALAAVFLQALPPFARKDGLKNLSPDELICMAALVAGVIAGTGQIGLGPVSLRGVLSGLTILVAAVTGGAGLGAAVGAVVSIIPGLAFTVAPVVVGAYAFAGLLAGLGRYLGRSGVILGYLAGSIILSAYIAQEVNLEKTVVEGALAALAFMLVPGAVIDGLKAMLNFPEKSDGAVQDGAGDGQLKEAVLQQMRRWRAVFGELSRILEQASVTAEPERPEKDFQGLFNEISSKVCKGCSLQKTCWEREFLKTYQSMMDMFAAVEVYGRVTPDDLSEELKKRCARTRELTITVTCLYDVYKLNRYWRGRFFENRGIIADQFRGLSETIGVMAGELETAGRVSRQRAQELKKKLKQKGLPVVDLVLMPVPGRDDCEIEVAARRCGGRLDCRNVLAPLVSGWMEARYSTAVANCTAAAEEEYCRCHLYPDLKFNLQLGVAGVGKGGSSISGDSYSFLPLRGGRFAVLLSDGMGSGPSAAVASSTTLSLLRRLLELGFDLGLAVKTANSVMMFRSAEETYATVDMAVLDLRAGSVKIVKKGAPPSFLVRDRRVQAIWASSLPVGIVDDVEMFETARHLSGGDVLVMMTDGVLNACESENCEEHWVSGVLREVGDRGAQEVADLVLQLAVTGRGTGDDMTVLVAKLVPVGEGDR